MNANQDALVYNEHYLASHARTSARQLLFGHVYVLIGTQLLGELSCAHDLSALVAIHPNKTYPSN
jgi:hypothetical protein